MDKKLLRLYQLEDGYCYNSYSLFLYDFATLFLKNNSQILDIVSGSGILGLLCARDYSI
ncbi:methyltransferase, partial [Campylobacter lari]